MNPVALTIGPLAIRAFTAWIAAGVLVTLVIVLIDAAWREEELLPRFDVLLGMVIGGIIGARAGHVWLNWAYFSAHTDQIRDIAGGGLDWHGAVVGALLVGVIVAAVRHVPLRHMLDALAVALPFGAAAGWLACGSAACGYGLEVRTLADFPGWLVIESPDVYGTVAPRLNLVPIGILLAVLVLLAVILITPLRRFYGVRLWLALALYALGMGVISFFRAEYVPFWFDHRADQILDYSVALFAILGYAVTIYARRWTDRRTHIIFKKGVTQ